jgi:hypothetical protein
VPAALFGGRSQFARLEDGGRLNPDWARAFAVGTLVALPRDGVGFCFLAMADCSPRYGCREAAVGRVPSGLTDDPRVQESLDLRLGYAGGTQYLDGVLPDLRGEGGGNLILIADLERA